MMKKVIAGLLILCMAMGLIGCSGSSDPGTSNVGSEVSAENTAPSADTPQQEQEESVEDSDTSPEMDLETMDMIKYNLYVEMNNNMVELLDDIDSYYAVVEYGDVFAFVPDSGLEYKYGISLYDSSIVEDAEAVAVMEPAYEGLDQLTLEIAAPMKALMDTFSEICHSYDFAENQYAKAKEYHSIVQNYADSFTEMARLYMEGIKVMGKEQVAKEEQRMLDEGLLITYNASHVITVARQLLDECYSQGVYDDNITELDLTNIRPLYDELVSTAAAYGEAVSDPNQLMKESLSGSPMRNLNSLLQAVEWMIKQVESQTPISDPGREFLGGIIHIEVVLSECIEEYNNAFASGT